MTIIPGVAIAVAVVPPLARGRLQLEHRQWAMAGGAFLLFMTNLIAIILSAASVFRLFGFRAHEEAEKDQLKLTYRHGYQLPHSDHPLGAADPDPPESCRPESDAHRDFASTWLRLQDRPFFGSGHYPFAAPRQTQRPGDDSDHASSSIRLRFRPQRTTCGEHFGPDTRLDIDQILVTQGGLSPQQAARLGNVLTGGVVRPVPGGEEAPFDLKASELKLISHLQRQVDDVLGGTPIRQTAPLRAQIGINEPIVFSLRLVSPEPLEKQTLTLLGAQLATKTSFPVKLQGEAEIQGADYQFALVSPDAQARLTAKDRQAIAGLLARVRRNPDLRLRILIASSQPLPRPLPETTPWREIQALASRSGLPTLQWSMEAAPPAPRQAPTTSEDGQAATTMPEGATKETSPPAPVLQGEFRVIQTF